MVWVRLCVKLLGDSGFTCASRYSGILAFRDYLCVKLLRDSTFEGLPVRGAIGGLYL